MVVAGGDFLHAIENVPGQGGENLTAIGSFGTTQIVPCLVNQLGNVLDTVGRRDSRRYIEGKVTIDGGGISLPRHRERLGGCLNAASRTLILQRRMHFNRIVGKSLVSVLTRSASRNQGEQRGGQQGDPDREETTVFSG